MPPLIGTPGELAVLNLYLDSLAAAPTAKK